MLVQEVGHFDFQERIKLRLMSCRLVGVSGVSPATYFTTSWRLNSMLVDAVLGHGLTPVKLASRGQYLTLIHNP